MTTCRDICTMALKEAGVLGVGQTALAEDINDTFTLLSRMMGQWQNRRWLVPGLTDVSAIGNSLKSNRIGPGQYYNSIRPDKIQAAYFIQLNTGNSLTVSYPLKQIFSYEDYSQLALKNLNNFPYAFFYDANYPYGDVYVWPVPTSQYEIHLITKLPITLKTSVSAFSFTGGAAYTNGVYVAVPMISTTGTGSGMTADITVAGNVVTSIVLNNGGNGYRINDSLTPNTTFMAGTGAGCVITVNGTDGTLDNILTLPEEYEEAIHYNLAIRACSLYQVQPQPQTVAMAKVGTNTIRKANTQVPSLIMPAALSGPTGFNIWNPDGY